MLVRRRRRPKERAAGRRASEFRSGHAFFRQASEVRRTSAPTVQFGHSLAAREWPECGKRLDPAGQIAAQTKSQ